MPEMPGFAEVAVDPDATLDVLTLSLAAEFRDVDAAAAMARLDILGAEVARASEQTDRTPGSQGLACGQILGSAHGFVGDREHYDDPGGHFGTDPPVLLDPFAGGGRVETNAPRNVVRPWQADEIVMRILNNLVAAYDRRGNIGAAIHAARLRLALPARASQRGLLQAELKAFQARLN